VNALAAEENNFLGRLLFVLSEIFLPAFKARARHKRRSGRRPPALPNQQSNCARCDYRQSGYEISQ
jgi:hypothetical protein